MMTDRDTAKKKIYISYDFHNDKDLKNEIVGKSQHKDATFKIANWSSKEDVKNPASDTRLRGFDRYPKAETRLLT